MIMVNGSTEQRRLSIVRLLIVLFSGTIVLVAGIYYSIKAVSDVHSFWAMKASKTWFAPYVNVTLKPTIYFESYNGPLLHNVVLGSIVADPCEPCRPSWGTYYDLDAAARALDLDRRLVRFRDRGGTAIVSFGDAANGELATVCMDIDKLTAAYQEVISRYELSTIDFDIEETALADQAANIRRAKAIRRLQRENKGLEVWLSLPVTPSGLSDEAVALITQTLRAGVELAGVNILTMNQGKSKSPDLSMKEVTIMSLTTASQQLENVYRQAGKPKEEGEIWKLIGVTPMIGQNNTAGDIFTQSDADGLAEFAQDREIGRLSLWSINRDAPCGPDIETARVSNTCSGVTQKPFEFSRIFMNRFPRPVMDHSPANRRPDGPVTGTAASGKNVSVSYSPDITPYPLWRQLKAYEKAAKVVWQGRVYLAKWWTKGDQPDAPVKHSWETPWRYLGPVLESDRKSISHESLKAGNRTRWDSENVFVANNKVIHDGKVFRAKWLSQGNEPQERPEQPYDHPWEYLGTVDCRNGNCMDSGIGANLLVNYDGLAGVSMEIREGADDGGMAGNIVQTHTNQSGKKTYKVLRGIYDLIFKMASGELIVDAVDCSGDNCTAGDIAATLSVDYKGLTGISMEVRKKDDVDGMAGKIVQSHTNQSGQKTYKVFRGSYDLIFKMASSELTVDAVDCSGDNCTAGDIAATLSVDYKGLTGINMEIRGEDGSADTTGPLVQLYNNQSGHTTYDVLRGPYDLIFKMASSELIVDAVDCSGGNCPAGDIAATLSVDYKGLTGINMEIREKDGVDGMAGKIVQTHSNQSGQKTYKVLRDSYDLIFKMASSELIVDDVDCSGDNCTAGDIAATLSVDYKGLTGISMEIRGEDGSTGTTGPPVQLHSNQSGHKTYDVLLNSYDLVFKKAAAELIVDAVNCNTGNCKAGEIASELIIDYDQLLASIEVRVDDGRLGTTGGLVETHDNQSGAQQYTVLRGFYDIAIKDADWSVIKDSVDCSNFECRLKFKSRDGAESPEIMQLEKKLSALKEKYTEKHPDVIAVQRRLDKLRAEE